MTRYDDLIREEKENAEIRENVKEDRERQTAERKRSYIAAFKNALPEFHQALLKNDIWNEFTYFRLIPLLGGNRKLQGVQLIAADGDGHHRIRCWISKEGKYYFSREYSKFNDVDTEISADELAELLFERVVTDVRYFPEFAIREAVKNDDYDETVFQYFSAVIRYHNAHTG